MSLPVPVSWFGGKTHLRDFILPHIEHSGTVYVEPFCGSANIFFAKQPHPVEVLNDLNGDIVNFFRVLQSRQHFRKFARLCRWTPYAADEFLRALTLLETPPGPDLSIDRAWSFFVRGTMGFGGAGESIGNWRRSFLSSQGTATVVSNWRMRLTMLEAWRDRLGRAQIDHKSALDVISYWDSPETTFYLDPPYVEDTRVSLNVYSHEMVDSDHLRLVSVLQTLKGRVVLSGYATSLYTILEESGWVRLDKTILSPMTGFSDGARRERTEVLWINRLGAEQSLWDTTVAPPSVSRPARVVVPPAPIASPPPDVERLPSPWNPPTTPTKSHQISLFE